MISSLYNGVEGVKTQSFGMDIIANNISNVNTGGFKYSNAEFKDIFSVRVTSQSANPADRNLSSTYGASKLVFSQGTPVASEGEFDVALHGKGFFGVLGADGGVYYTRNGSLVRDANGNLVDNYGNFVLGTMNPAFSSITYSDRVSNIMGSQNGVYATNGYTVSNDEKFNIADIGAQRPLQVPNNMYLPPKVTENVQFSGNLNSSTKLELVTINLNKDSATLTKDPNSGKYTLSGSVSNADVFSAKKDDKILITFSDDNGNKLNFEAVLDENGNYKTNELDLASLDENTLKLDTLQIATEQEKGNTDILEASLFNTDGSKSTVRVTLERILPDPGEIAYKAVAQIYNANNEPVGEPSEGMLSFDEKGALKNSTLTSINNPDGGSVSLDFGTPIEDGVIGSGFNGIYVHPDKSKSVTYKQDGVAEGFFNKYQISDDGSIVAQFSNGQVKVVGKLALYNFINEEGLHAVGDNLFAATGKSGEASFIMKDGQVVNTAKFKGGFLEQSNVDLGMELSTLITIQRAYDASSKSITTSDELLKNAINMKK